MAGSVGLVQFNQGDDVSSAEFREGLNAIAQQAADGTAWAFGFGLIGGYSPGTGFTVSFDESLLPTMRKEHFVAKITAAADEDGGYAWKEMEVTGENALGEKEHGRASKEAEGESPAADLAYDYNGSTRVRAETVVTMWEIEDTAGVKRYWIDCRGGSDFIVANITAYSSGLYSWAQASGDGAGSENLREINGREGIQPGTKVLIWPDPATENGYLFDHAEGVPSGDGAVEIGGEVTDWDRRMDTEARGVKLDVIADVTYDEESGELEKVPMTLEFDSSGRLVSVSVGSSTNIATATDCEIAI